MRVHYAIVFVSDMQRAVGFYRDVLGLTLRFETTHWTEFATDGATLALHLSEAARPGAPQSRDAAAGSCRPGLQVKNLDEFHQRMLTSNVSCLQAPKDVFGTRIAQYADPDGLVISVSEAHGGA